MLKIFFLFFQLDFLSIRFLLQIRPYFLKKLRKLAKNIETKIIKYILTLQSQLPKVQPKVRVGLKGAEEDQKALQVELAEASLKKLLKRSRPLKRPKPNFRTFLMLRVMKFKKFLKVLMKALKVQKMRMRIQIKLDQSRPIKINQDLSRSIKTNQD